MTPETWWGLGAVAFVNIAFATLMCFGDQARRRHLVFRNLDYAVKNGYFEPAGVLHDATLDEIAYSFAKRYNYQTADIAPYVRKWLRKRGWVWSD